MDDRTVAMNLRSDFRPDQRIDTGIKRRTPRRLFIGEKNFIGCDRDVIDQPIQITHSQAGPITDHKSTAAGAYQFINDTWNGAASALGLGDFSPRSQDMAAVWLLQKNGSLADVMAGFDGLDGIQDPNERNSERLRLIKVYKPTDA